MRPVTREEPTSGEFKLNLSEYGRALWRKKYFLLIPVLVSAAVAAFGVRLLRPVYQSSSVIRVDDSQSATRIVPGMQNRSGRREKDQEILAKIEAVIDGTEFQDELIRRLRLTESTNLQNAIELELTTRQVPITREEYTYRRLRELLGKKSGIKRAGPGMFRIYFSDPSAEASYHLADAMANLFIELQDRKELKTIKSSSEFIDEQKKQAKFGLDVAEQKLEALKKRMAERGLETNPVSAVNISSAENLMGQLRIQVQEKAQLTANLRRSVSDRAGVTLEDARFAGDQRVRQLENKMIARQQSELLNALQGSGESAASRENEGDFDDTKGSLQTLLSSLVLGSYSEVVADYRPLIVEYYFQKVAQKALSEKERSLAGYLETYKGRVAREPQMERELTRLQQDVNTNRDVYESFLTAQTTSQITEAAEYADLGATTEVVEKAQKPLIPVYPKKPKILVLAVLFGGVIGLTGLVFSEYIDASFRNVEEVEKDLGVKVLGTVPRLDHTKKWRRDGSAKRAIAWATLTVVLTVGAVAGFYFRGKQIEKQAIEVTNARVEMNR